MAVAEKFHRLGDLEWAVLRTVVYRLARLEAMGWDVSLSVNLSSVSLQKFGFGEQVCALLEEAGVSGTRLTVEVVETQPIIVSEMLKSNLDCMSACGINISLDDFGVGYSSLDLFSQLHFDEIKIDYSMTSRLETSSGHIAVSLAIEGARRYGATIVAEGIETYEQHRRLVEMGVQRGQGFLFEKAMPFERFVQFIAAPQMICPEPEAVFADCPAI